VGYPKKFDHAPRTAVPLEIVGRQIRQADGTYAALNAGDPVPDDADVVYDIVISSETPVQRPWGIEVLSHTAAAIDMSLAKRGLSFLLEHGGDNAPYRVNPDLHVGIVENIRLDTEKRRLLGSVRFGSSARAEQTEQEFQDGTRIWISLGWLPLKRPKLVKPASGPDGQDEFLVQRWQPCETSSVSVPADVNSHVGLRSNGGGVDVPQEGLVPEEEDPMKQVKDDTGATITVEDSDARPAIEIQTRSAGETVAERNKEMGEIVKVCLQHGLQERAGEFIEKGYSLQQVKGLILDLRSSKPVNAQPAAEALAKSGQPGTVKLSPKDASRYSMVRGIRSLIAVREGRQSKIDGLEGEVHAEITKQADNAGIQTRGGLFVPMRLADVSDEFAEAQLERQTRAVSMGPGVATGGSEIVTRGVGEFIDLLRNRTRCVAMGAQLIPGLVGTMTWPRLTQDPVVQWMGTNPASGAADSGAKFGFITSTPKTLIGTVPFPRQLVNLTNLDVEGLLRRVLGLGHGLALDLGAITGAGTDRQPQGIIGNPDVPTQAMGNTVPTYKLLRQIIGTILKKNVPGDSIGYMTTPELAAVLSATLMAANVPGFIWNGTIQDGQIGGYPATATSQMPITNGTDHALIAGAWETLVFCLWGALEVVVDNLTLATSGQIRLTTFQMADVVNQRPEGFVVCTGARLA
jgi:HK97 family phage major capsid protein